MIRVLARVLDFTGSDIERTIRKGQPNGYTPLNAQSKVPNEFLPEGLGGGGASSWNELSDRPNWLIYSTLGDFEGGHGHDISQISGLSDALNNKADTEHDHDASDIVSGLFSIERGGTGNSLFIQNRIINFDGEKLYSLSAINANRALISDADGMPIHSGVTATELNHLAGATSNIQNQINALSGGGGAATWGLITGDIQDQADLIALINSAGGLDLQGVTENGSTTTIKMEVESNDDAFTIKNSSSGDQPGYYRMTTSSGTDKARVGFLSTNAIFEVRNYLNGEMRFSTNNSTFMTALPNGNVGINQNSPSERLHVGGNVRANNFIFG